MYIIPEPQKMHLEEGEYTIRFDRKIVLDVSCPAEAYECRMYGIRAGGDERGLGKGGGSAVGGSRSGRGGISA